MLEDIPLPAAREAKHDGVSAAERGLARVRSQLAVVRALADCAEVLAQKGETDPLGEQVISEMAALGCRLFEAAAALAEPTGSEDSGVFARPK
jgi:hypothetical protein